MATARTAFWRHHSASGSPLQKSEEALRMLWFNPGRQLSNTAAYSHPPTPVGWGKNWKGESEKEAHGLR